MSLVTFQSLYKYGHCSQFLEDLLSEDIQNDNLMTMVTEAGSVSVSRRVMQLLSPLLGSMLTGLPGSGAREGEVVTVIVPDTDTTAVSKMMELLINGETNVDTEKSQEGILSLAECLGVRIHNLETFSSCKKESYEVGQTIEVFISGSNINNNAGAQKDVIEMKLEDSCGDHIHTEDEGDNDITGVKSEESSAIDDESTELSAPHFPDPVPLRKSIKSDGFKEDDVNKLLHGLREKAINSMKSKSNDNPPFQTMIKTALRQIDDKNGSSLKAIHKFVCANYNVDDATVGRRINIALTKMLASKELVATSKNCYKLSSCVKNQVVATRVLGTVKWFNIHKKYGFIIREDTKKDLYMHQNQINNSETPLYGGEVILSSTFI